MCPVILQKAGGHPDDLDEEAKAAFNGEGHRSWKIVFDENSLRDLLDKVPVCRCGKKLILVREETS